MSNTTQGLVCFDTNVLVYQFDHTNTKKQSLATALIKHHTETGQAMISSQVMQEFVNVARTKFIDQFRAGELELYLREILQPLLAHAPTFEFYERALVLCQRYQLSWYDALIVQAALDLECDTLYSEDLQAGQQFDGLTVVNPFQALP